MALYHQVPSLAPKRETPKPAPKPEVEALKAEIAEKEKPAARKPKAPLRTKRTTLRSVRIDNEVLAWLMSSGPGWQTRLNDILRAAMK